jgi:hypothetical protein
VAHGCYKAEPGVGAFHHGKDGQPPTPIKYERTPWGACYVTLQNTEKPGRYEYHETHGVLPCIRLGQSGASSINWAVPVDDTTTHWFGVSFYPFDESGNVPEEALRKINSITPTDQGGPFYEGWAEDVGHWWNHGHPLRQGPIWEDEVIMGSQGTPERGGIPDFEKWRLATSDRGVQLMHDLWREQVELVQQGLDPVGIVRGEEAEEIIPVPGDQRFVDWEMGYRMWDRSLEERTRQYQDLLRAGRKQPVRV